MPSKQSNRISPLDPLPVYCTLYILKDNDKYVAHLLSDGGASYFDINLTHDDIKNLNTLLQTAMQAVSDKFERGNAYEEALQELARQGNYAYQRIFANALGRISTVFAGGINQVVSIVSDSFFVPWDLLYDRPPWTLTTSDDYIGGYWGTRYCIRRCIEQSENIRGYIQPYLETLRPKVGLVTSDSLDYVKSIEIPALKRLHSRRKIELVHLGELSTARRSEEFQKLDSFLREEWHFLHFACHAFEKEPIDKSELSIAKKFSISMIDFMINGFDLSYHPLVILNACRTGITNPLYTSSWVRKLWEHGARGVLATDIKVRDDFAASFSDVFYRDLLKGIPIGRALLNTRSHFWEQQRNPFGLAYALFSPPSIKVVKPRNS